MEASTKRNVLLSSILIIALIGVGLYLYFYLVKPVEQELERVKLEQEQEDKLIGLLSSKLKEKQNVVTTGTSVLQQRVPVAPLVDQFLVQLEKIELLTNNQIKSIQIADNKAEIKNKSERDHSGKTGESPSANQSEEQENPIMEIPGQLKRVTFNLQMVAPNYEQMEEFITEIEKLSRISMIDALQFTAPSTNSSRANTQDLSYQVTLSTFYIENMQELINDLPKVEFLEPSQKKVPVSEQILHSESIGEDARIEHISPPAPTVPIMKAPETEAVYESEDSIASEEE